MLTEKNAIILGMAATLAAFAFPPLTVTRSRYEGQFDGWAFIGNVPFGTSIDVPILLAELLGIAILTAGLYFLARMD